MPTADSLDKSALFRPAGNQRRTRITAFFPARSRIKAQPAALLFRPMAFVTAVNEQGADLGFKELKLLRRDFCMRGFRTTECQRYDSYPHSQRTGEIEAVGTQKRMLDGNWIHCVAL